MVLLAAIQALFIYFHTLQRSFSPLSFYTLLKEMRLGWSGTDRAALCGAEGAEVGREAGLLGWGGQQRGSGHVWESGDSLGRSKPKLQKVRGLQIGGKKNCQSSCVHVCMRVCVEVFMSKCLQTC